MNAEVSSYLVPATLAHFADADEPKGFLHWTYAISLFTVSERLRSNVCGETLKLETARHVVAMARGRIEANWQQRGHMTHWCDADYEALAREIADKLPRHPWVVHFAAEHLETARDRVFADTRLTKGDPMFAVRTYNTSNIDVSRIKIFHVITVEFTNEDAIETVDRSLDYLRDLRSTKDYRQFIPLNRILTGMRRVHDVVLRN